MSADDLEGIANVTVPESFRPRSGPGRKTFPQLEQSLQAAWVESAKNLRVELVEQMDALIAAAHCDDDHYNQPARQELLRRANNIRGMAEADGSELSSDIAHAIFEIVEGADAPEVGFKKTIGLLAESCRGLLGFERRARYGALHEHVQRMLRAAHLNAQAAS